MSGFPMELDRGGLKVGFDEECLAYLLALDEATPPMYRRQDRDAKRLEDLLQDMGRYTVGTHGASALAKPAVLFKRMEEMGLVQRVKIPDEPISYRLTQLGERLCSQVKLGRLRDDVNRARSRGPVEDAVVEDAGDVEIVEPPAELEAGP